MTEIGLTIDSFCPSAGGVVKISFLVVGHDIVYRGECSEIILSISQNTRACIGVDCNQQSTVEKYGNNYSLSKFKYNVKYVTNNDRGNRTMVRRITTPTTSC